MRIKILLLGFLTIAFGCSKDDETTDCPLTDDLDLFDELWMNFDQKYAAFEVLDKDWDLIRERYRSLIDENSSRSDLFLVFRSLLFELEDAHSDLYTDSNLGSIQYFFEVVENAPRNYVGWSDMQAKYLENLVEITSRLAYGKIIDTDIGYVRLNTFQGESSDFDIINRMLSDNNSLQGIIIDVRGNDGGSESNARQVASHFIDSSLVYRYARIKDGCERNILSDFIEVEMDPSESNYYDGNVVLITNKSTFSAGEDFTLMMKSINKVTHIGDNTLGGFATNPKWNTLSNGWRYRISTSLNYDINKKPIIDGIQPDEVLILSDDDLRDNADKILERGIEILR